MDPVLAALKVALLSYKAELRAISGEEETARVYLENLTKRKERLTQAVAAIEAKLAPQEKENGTEVVLL